MLIQYVYNTKNKSNPKRRKVGVLVALSKDQIGWSRCLKGDKFNRSEGVKIAALRAKEIDLMDAKVCDSMQIDFIKMVNRARRYFK